MPTKTAPRPAAASAPSVTEALSDDVGAFKAMVITRDASIREQGFVSEKLKAQLATLGRHRFGTKSEALDQFELAIEEMERAQGVAEAGGGDDQADSLEPESTDAKRQPKRRPLSVHPPREEIVHAPAAADCASCSESMRPLDENAREVLD